MSTLVFVDCEAAGACPSIGQLTEFGAVTYPKKSQFHGVLCHSKPSKDNPAIPEIMYKPTFEQERDVFLLFDEWLKLECKGRPIFVSDNPAYDWQWINDGFHRTLGRNPFGFSARRIGDFYAGLMNDFWRSNDWKNFRKTKHDHHPVHDALGNAEAFEELMKITLARSLKA